MFIPHTDADREEMLKTIGVSSIDAFFENLPGCKIDAPLNLPTPTTEMEALAEISYIASANESVKDLSSFWVQALTIITSPQRSIQFFGAVNFIPLTRPINLKSLKVPSRLFLSFRA